MGSRSGFYKGLLALAVAVAINLGFSPRVRAQQIGGSIRGTVTDPSGAVIPGVKMTATNVATGVLTVTTTGANGVYEFLDLPAPGNYNVTAEHQGFKTFSARRISLGVSQIYVLHVEMQLGRVTQQVTVEAAPVQVEKTSMELGATLTGSQITNLPLANRNWVQLQLTLPGVVNAADGRGDFSTNGSEPDQNSYLVDGIDTNDLPLNTPLLGQLSPDAIAQVKMITNTLNPEYGRNSGAILDAVTKSGTNKFHGDGFEFYRDNSLNARNFFQSSPYAFHWNNFGGTIGGPIVKNHTFFFFSYQAYRERVPEGSSGPTTVFSAAQRGGYFPDIATSSTKSPTPLTGENGTLYPAGTPYSTIFPTGHIPASDFNPLSLSLLNKFVPLPNQGTSEYSFVPVIAENQNQFFTRIDENISPKDRLWGGWLWETAPDTETLPFTGANLPGFAQSDKRHIQTYSLTWDHTFNPTTLNEARIGYTRFNYDAVVPISPVNPSSVGFTGIRPQNPSEASYPVIGVTGYFTLGFSNNGPQPRIDQTSQVDDNLSKVVGNHTFKVGFDMRHFEVYNPFAHELSGSYGFGGTGVYSTGDPAADFMMGIPDTYAQGGGDVVNARGQEYYFYFQDQWKMRRNLTITYGAGYQIDTPTVDNFHANHAMSHFTPGLQSTVYPNAPLGYTYQGDSGVSAAGKTMYSDIGPRFGFAWSPGSSGTWSVRGGYGIYYNRELEEQQLQFVNEAPYSPASSGATNCGGSPAFANPFMDIASGALCNNPFPAPLSPPSSVSFLPYLPTFLYTIDPNNVVPYSQNFNFTIEHQFSKTTILSVGYVGAQGRHEVVLRDLNPGLNPSACLAGLGAEGGCTSLRLFQQFFYPQNYNYGLDPRYGADFASPVNGLPGLSIWGIGNNQTTGISNYNALEVNFMKHMSHGMQFNAVYTWSHAFDNGSGFENSGFGGGGFGQFGSVRATNPFNQTLYNYGPSEYDALNRFVFSYSYMLPIHHFQNWAAKRVLDGWQLSGITTLQSGFPLDVVDSSYTSLTCSALNWTACWDVPNVTAKAQYVDPHNSSFVNTVYSPGTPTSSHDHYLFNPNTFAHAPLGTFGDASRNLLRGPDYINFDAGLYKDVPVTESKYFQLRFEFYNIMNHTQWNPSGVVTDINDPNFGRILAADNPRIIQLAGKFFF